MTEKERIAELEAKLLAVQRTEAGGKDPETLAKAKNLARMSWYDISFILGYLGMDETLGQVDVEDLKEQLIERKYASLSGANKGVLSW